MRRLHLKLYLAIIGTMVAFALSCVIAWHHFAPSRSSLAEVETTSALAAALLEAPDADEARRRAVIDSLSQQMHADVALFDAGIDCEVERDLWTTCFTPKELRLLLAHAGFAIEELWSVTPGNYGRRAPSIDEPEFFVAATTA